MYHNLDLLKLSNREMRYIRGSQISIIFQDPMTSFNPVLTIGQQVLRTHPHQAIFPALAWQLRCLPSTFWAMACATH